MLAAGVHPKIVCERLGHSSIKITLDTYSHVLPTMQEEATNRLTELLYGCKSDIATAEDLGSPRASLIGNERN